jgi:DNA polymerase V
MYVIIDCNNFFVSCEQVFQPSLKGRPVCVLSNNDGCVVSRSQEAKDLGIPMGAPYFKYKDVIENNNGVIFSANFSLYGDMSNRVMNTVAKFTPDIEIYSIDEAFLSFDHISKKDYSEYARDIRKTVLQNTGIPISIGIGQTKTLSKVANKIAKKHKEFEGVFNLDAYPKDEQLAILNSVNVKDIWGIGRQFTKFLYQHQIHTAFDLISQSDRWI